MALNGIRFIRGNGGLSRPLPGEDHTSGLICFSGNFPIGYGTDNIRQIVDLADAEAKGITGLPGDAFADLHYQS